MKTFSAIALCLAFLVLLLQPFQALSHHCETGFNVTAVEVTSTGDEKMLLPGSKLEITYDLGTLPFDDIEVEECLINNVECDDTFVEGEDNQIKITYTVQLGDTARAMGEIPVEIVLRSDSLNATTVLCDADAAGISLYGVHTGVAIESVTVSPSTGFLTLKNNVATITITGNENITLGDSCTVNNQNVTEQPQEDPKILTLKYTFEATHDNWNSGALPISCVVQDFFALEREIKAFTDENTLGGDGVELKAPKVSISPDEGTVKEGDDITITVVFNKNVTFTSATVNGKPVKFTYFDPKRGTKNTMATSFTFVGVYTVAVGDATWEAGKLPISLVFEDQTGASATQTEITEPNNVEGDPAPAPDRSEESESDSEKGKLGTGAIIGIVLGSAVVLAAFAIVILGFSVVIVKKYSKNKNYMPHTELDFVKDVPEVDF